MIATPLGALRVSSVHLSHLAPLTRLPQIARIKEILKAAPEEGSAWCGGHPDPASGWLEELEPPMPDSFVLMGDMNFAPGSAESDAMVGGMSAGHGRLTSRKGLVDAWVEAGHREDDGSTHPKAGARIDHCFTVTGIAPHITRAWVDDAAKGSYHWPLRVTFADPRSGAF